MGAGAADRPIRVLVADDHPLLRDGVASVLALRPDMSVVGEASTGAQAVDLFVALQPDVTLMDLRMPQMSGVDAIRAIRARHPRARIIVLTTYGGDVQAKSALNAGALGYLLKMSLRRELVDAIRAVHDGRRFLTPDIAAELARHDGDELLTEREIDVLQAMVDGASNKEVGRKLGVGEETVKSHLRSIYAKLRVSDRLEAVAQAVKRGIIAF